MRFTHAAPPTVAALVLGLPVPAVAAAASAAFRLRSPVALFRETFTRPQQPDTVSSQSQFRNDEPFEYYNPIRAPQPQRQHPSRTPASRRPPSSLSSSSVRSLRRTPRLPERREPRSRSPLPPARSSFRAPRGLQRDRQAQQPLEAGIGFESSGSTTPESFQRLVQLDSYWPQRSTHISRRTHEAISFALEAIRAGNGVNATPLTADPLEEGARMSDLLTSNAPSGAAGASRARNGASRPSPSTGSATAGQARILTPTQIMAQRQRREAARREQAQQQTGDVGVVENPRQTGGRADPPPNTITVPPGGVTIGRRSENVPVTNGGGSRPRTTTNPPQSQSQSQSQPQTQPVRAQQPRQPATDPSYAGQIDKNRTEAFEKLSMPATAGPNPPQSQPSQPVPPVPPQQSAQASFPHAFERWEMLSSHWEGLTSSWIRKLELNTEELNNKPIDQQMARQITDLSAAGANLFHAVVELQRLRASSERKFKRWFFETRNEQEQAQERIAELERQLRIARESGNTSSAPIEAVRAEKSKAEELVREMHRELRISKEEARRAWEELGRREQEERDRTIALRSGEPTLIGGVQVVPMAGMSRHMGSSSRPQTRGGPIPGGPGPTQMSGQQPSQQQPREAYSRSQTTLESPELEQEQFTYQPGTTSPTGTDPFTETATPREQPPLRHEPDTRFYASPPRTHAQPVATAATARAAISPSRSQNESTSPSRFYQQGGMSTAVYQPITTTAPSQRPVTSTTDRSDNRSYIPSTASGHGSHGSRGSEEEYHINPDGSYTLDSQGRRIPSNQPIMSPEVGEEEDDDEDYTAEVERERMLAHQYSQRQAAAAAHASPRGSAGSLPMGTTQRSAAASASQQQQTSPSSRSHSSTISAISQPMTQIVSPVSPDYEGDGYTQRAQLQPRVEDDDEIPSNIVTGWESINVPPRHHHPSRLSAIIEERSGRTSPSRTSYASETNPTAQRGGGNNYGTSTGGAAARRRLSPEQEADD